MVLVRVVTYEGWSLSKRSLKGMVCVQVISDGGWGGAVCVKVVSDEEWSVSRCSLMMCRSRLEVNKRSG